MRGRGKSGGMDQGGGGSNAGIFPLCNPIIYGRGCAVVPEQQLGGFQE